MSSLPALNVSDMTLDSPTEEEIPLHLPKAEEIPLHSIPTAREARKRFYGSNNNGTLSQLKVKQEALDKPMWEVSNEAFDTSLFPYRVEGPGGAPIPTPAEIAAAMPTTLPFHKSVWRVGPYMVKVSTFPTPLKEAENILYLARKSTVRVPKVYAAFASKEVDVLQYNAKRPDFKEGDENLEYYFLVMEYIDGVTVMSLEDNWGDFRHLFNEIGAKIGEQLRRLRSVPPEDPSHFGRIEGRPYVHMRPFDHAPAPDFNYGPFKSYDECVKRIIHSGKLCEAFSLGGKEYSPLQRALFRDSPAAFLDCAGPNDRLPVLSHMDFVVHNIMIKLTKDEKGKAIGVDEVVIIDWETLCWMPSWYEAGDVFRQSTTRIYPELDAALAELIFPYLLPVNMVIVSSFAQCVRETLHLHHDM